jgi:hypothetical protein
MRQPEAVRYPVVVLLVACRAVVCALAAGPARAGAGSRALPHCDGQAGPVEQEQPGEAAT